MRFTRDNSYDLYQAKNRDSKNAVTHHAVIEFQPNLGFRYLITQTIGAVFIHQGMNEKGISITGNAAPPNNYQPKQFFDDDIFRVLLESADSLKKVDQIIAEYQGDYDEIITIGSGSENNGAIYDISHIKRVKHELANNKQLYVTNHFLENTLPQSGTQFSYLRYQAIEDYIQHHNIASVDNLIELLSLDKVNNNGTVHSIIFNPKQKILYMSFAPHFAARGKWLKYDWNKDEIVLK